MSKLVKYAFLHSFQLNKTYEKEKRIRFTFKIINKETWNPL